MATYQTYTQIGLAEDVSNVITNISPTKYPFQSSIGSEKCSAKLFEWQEDSLRAVTDNKKVEGFDASSDTMVPTVMRSNVTQILEKTIKVSATSDAAKTYGRAKETAYQIAKGAEECKRDLEHAMVGFDRAAAVGAAAVPRSMASALYQVTTNEAGGTAALTETMVLNLHEDLYTLGSEADVLMIKPADSLITAGFAAVANTRSRDFSVGKKVVNAVDVYVSPFGELKIVINRFMLATHALMYDPSMFCKVALRPWTRTLLAKVGDSERHMIVGEYSLKSKNFGSHGTIDALT